MKMMSGHAAKFSLLMEIGRLSDFSEIDLLNNAR